MTDVRAGVPDAARDLRRTDGRLRAWATIPDLADKEALSGHLANIRSIPGVAHRLGVPTLHVREAVRAHGLPLPARGGAYAADPETAALLADVEWLKRVYEVERRSVDSLRLQLRVSERIVRAALERAGIRVRTRSEQLRRARPKAEGASANRRRADLAASVASERARALVDLYGVTDRVVVARAEYPGESLGELASRLGMTKDAYAARLTRALAKYGAPPASEGVADAE